MIGTKAKLSYVLGQDPVVSDVAHCGTATAANAPVFGVVARRRTRRALPTVLIIAPGIEDAATARALNSLGMSRKFQTIVLIDGKSKQTWIAAYGNAIPVFHYGEL